MILPGGLRLTNPSSNLRAILSMVMAMGVFIASDSCMKLALQDAPLFQLVFMRGFAAVTLCLVLIVALDQAGHLHKTLNPWLVARGLCEVVANFAFTFAIYHMAIADVTAIAQTCPLMVLLGARLLWGERLGLLRLGLIGLGIIGAMLVAQPGASAASPYAVLGFLTAISAASRDLITRRVPSSIPALIVAFTVLLILMIAGGIGMVMVETPVLPQPRHFLLMALAGALMIAGHFLVFVAYRIGETRSVAPFMYTLTIWAVLAGIILFNDIPNLLAIVGMGLVVVAGLLVILLDGWQRHSGRLGAAEA